MTCRLYNLQLFPGYHPDKPSRIWPHHQGIYILKGYCGQRYDYIAQHGMEAAQVAYSPVLSIPVIQIGSIPYLIEAFPFFLTAPGLPVIIREELFLIH